MHRCSFVRMKDIYPHMDTGLFVHNVVITISGRYIALGWVLNFVLRSTQVAVSSVNFDDFVCDSELESENRFWQSIADNFDNNDGTTTGANTTHAMGIISCETTKSEFTMIQPIMREDVSSAKLSEATELNDSIKVYSKPSKSKFKHLILRKISRFFPLSCNLQQHVLCQAANKTEKDLLHEPYVWFTIVLESIRNQDWKISRVRLQSRLQGFHQLSFMGAGCKFMQDTGLIEVWSTVYKKNSVLKMLEGKATVVAWGFACAQILLCTSRY